MMRTTITGITVSKTFDDGSTYEIKITHSQDEDANYVAISTPNHQILLHADEWPEVRNVIDSFLTVSTTQKESLAEMELGIRQCCEIIDLATTRALAVDGPVGHVRDAMTNKEWRRLYETLKRLAGP